MPTKKATANKKSAKKKAVKAALGAKKTTKKKSTATKRSSKKASPPKKTKRSPEQQFVATQELAYFLAEKDGFKRNPTHYWLDAETEIARQS